MKQIYTILLTTIALLTGCENKYPADIENSTSDYYIEYTSTDAMYGFDEVDFGAKIIAVTWEDGVGRMYFDRPIKKIGYEAFRYWRNLTSIDIPNSVTSIGDSAFYYCSSLTSVNLGNSVTSIGDSAFYYCSSLTSINIPNSVKSIGSSAFSDCDNLTSITIPNSVTSIGGGAFWGCSSLTSVYCKATNPPTGGDRMFYDNATNRKIYVPRNSVNAYKSATYWSTYAADIVGYDFE